VFDISSRFKTVFGCRQLRCVGYTPQSFQGIVFFISISSTGHWACPPP
jgi:hypothetical protein